MISTRVKKDIEWYNNDAPQPPPNPVGSIRMDNAENWLIRPYELPPMREAIRREFSSEDLDYPHDSAGDAALLKVTANFFNKFFSPRVPVEDSHILCQGGTFQILDSLVYGICDEGEGLLIDVPFWSGFGVVTKMRNRTRLIEVPRPTSFSDPGEIIEHYEKAMHSQPCRVRGIIICNPHNPYGHIYPLSYMKAVLQFCEKHDLHYISDEIYGLSTWGSSRIPAEVCGPDVFESPVGKFTSVLSLDLEELKINPARVHVVYGISKDLGSSGLRLGTLVSQSNPELLAAASTVEIYTVSSATTIMTNALFSNLCETEVWLEKSRRLLRQSADYMGKFMAFHKISFYRPIAGVFIWARLGGRSATLESDLALWRRIAEAGAAVAYGAAFHEAEPGWFRITFALPRKDLVEGLRRVEVGLEMKESFSAEED